MRPLNFFYSRAMKFLVVIGCLVVGAVHAGIETDLCEMCPVSSLQIGASYTRANIQVDGQSSFNGNLGGVQAIYEYQPCNGFYGGLRAAWKQGRTSNSSAHRNVVYVDVQERLGYTYTSCCHYWSLTPFSGLGYRYLGHKLSESGESSVKFGYNEFYVPVGFLSKYFFCSCWALGVNFTWMPQVYPTVEISPLEGARWILKNTLGNFLVELPLTWFYDNRFSVVFKPFYERWQDGRSTAKTSSGQALDLPKNSYNFWGAELNMAFSF